MERIEQTLNDLHANLALDEHLLLEAEAGQGAEVLRLWEWPHTAVVLGAAGRIADDVNREACEQDGVALSRRSSGGGTVLVGRGCLIYSLVLRIDRSPKLNGIIATQAYVLDAIGNALARLVPGIERKGYGDLILNGRKFGGSAQQRKREHLLFHGTILYDFDLPLVERYLHEPPKQPEYRESRKHGEFVTNLPLAREQICRTMIDAWDARDMIQVNVEVDSQRLANPEWIERM